MTYTFGIFLISRPSEISHLRSVDDLFELTLAGKATEGIPEIRKVEQLNSLISGESTEDLLTQVDHQFDSDSALYLVAKSFRNSVARADNDLISRVASEWVESESWRNTNVNPFDLYGMLHYLNSVCITACAEDKEVYLLLSK